MKHKSSARMVAPHEEWSRKRVCYSGRPPELSCALKFGLMTLLLVGFYALPTSSAIDARGEISTSTRPDLLCNVGSGYECVCNRSRGDRDATSTPCSSLIDIKARKISALCIRMKYVVLEGRLYTNESYQQYFRRRLAQLTSAYCDRQPVECGPGTLSMLRYEVARRDGIQVNSSWNRHLFEHDEDEPSFTDKNVVLLRVTFLDFNRTEACFIVTKSVETGPLSEVLTVDPNTVKSMLSSQLAPLSRILGGIRVEGLKIADIKKWREPADNTVLVGIICVIAAAIAVCCLVAIIKNCRDRRAKTKKGKIKSTRSYGTCTERFMLSNNEITPNGKPKSKSKSITSIISGLSTRKKKLSVTTGKKALTQGEHTSSRCTSAIYSNIFACDASQLPEERLVGWNSLDSATHGEIEDSHSNGPNFTTQPPNLVLIGYMSADKSSTPVSGSSPSIGLLGVQQLPQFERPLSRRGSRDSPTSAQGVEEGILENREETPVPMGDEQRPNSSSRWSSDNDDDGGGSDSDTGATMIYHLLGESQKGKCEIVIGDTDFTAPVSSVEHIHAEQQQQPSSGSDDDESKTFPRHCYEKLQEESPNQSPSDELAFGAL